jgi:CO dehydrogenase/acetyl-CoA synthase gamma subunit (corrinoid Fe-S protein)
MVVQQEMAEIYPPDAEDLASFLPETDCKRCGFSSCIDFSASLLQKKISPDECPGLGKEYARVVASVVELNKDPIPYNVMMEQEPCSLIEINSPSEASPLLITCNFRETVRIMKEILERTSTRAFLLPTFTHGFSVDNAAHERMFKAVEVWKAMKENAVEEKVGKPVLVIPGLAESERNSVKQMTRWEVVIGPVSGFLLPLFILKHPGLLSEKST